jgi:hypothetical protein
MLGLSPKNEFMEYSQRDHKRNPFPKGNGFLIFIDVQNA